LFIRFSFSAFSYFLLLRDLWGNANFRVGLQKHVITAELYAVHVYLIDGTPESVTDFTQYSYKSVENKAMLFPLYYLFILLLN